jgi:hypothetical protein
MNRFTGLESRCLAASTKADSKRGANPHAEVRIPICASLPMSVTIFTMQGLVQSNRVNHTAITLSSLLTSMTVFACTNGDARPLAIPPDGRPPDAMIAPPDAKKTCEVPVTNVGDGHHYAGENCMDCHNGDSANGAPKFTVAGTLYNGPSGVKPVPNATVTLIDAMGREFRLPTQQNGNFWTSADVALPVTSAASSCPKTKPMVSPSLGNCNSSGCHSDRATVLPAWVACICKLYLNPTVHLCCESAAKPHLM